MWGDESFSSEFSPAGVDVAVEDVRDKAPKTTLGAEKWVVPSATSSVKSGDSAVRRRTRVITRLELIHLLRTLPRVLGIETQAKNRSRYCVGLVGFPNVGKSSVINTILGVSKSSHGKPYGRTSTHTSTDYVLIPCLYCLQECVVSAYPLLLGRRNTSRRWILTPILCSAIVPVSSFRRL